MLVKGRGNYLSLRRLRQRPEPGRPACSADEEEFRRNCGQSTPGPSRPATARCRTSISAPCRQCGTKWPATTATAWAGNARTTSDCFYYQARRRVQNAQILIVNHALFFTDLALRQRGASILPDYDVVVFDEAHTMEAVAGEHLGLRITSGQVEFMLNKLYNDRTNRGLLVHHQLREPQQAGAGVPRPGRRVLRSLDQLARPASRPATAASATPDIVANLAERRAWQACRPRCREQRQATRKARGAAGFHRRRRPAGGPGRRARQWLAPAACPRPSIGSMRCRAARPAGHAWPPPVDVGPVLREHALQQGSHRDLDQRHPGRGRRARSISSSRGSGSRKTATLCLGSPFDYRRQAQLILLDGMPEPGRRADAATSRRPSR